jgi:hypothetical protein
MFSLSVAAAKVGFDIRLAYVESAFKRDVHSFDNIDKQSDHNGADTTSGVDDIESGIGEKLGIVVQMISTIVTAFFRISVFEAVETNFGCFYRYSRDGHCCGTHCYC